MATELWVTDGDIHVGSYEHDTEAYIQKVASYVAEHIDCTGIHDIINEVLIMQAQKGSMSCAVGINIYFCRIINWQFYSRIKRFWIRTVLYGVIAYHFFT